MIDVREVLPPLYKYVLAHINKYNWIDRDDPEGVYWKVVKRIPAKQYGNNKRDFEWTSFGPSKYFGQEVDYWVPLPEYVDKHILQQIKEHLDEKGC